MFVANITVKVFYSFVNLNLKLHNLDEHFDINFMEQNLFFYSCAKNRIFTILF